MNIFLFWTKWLFCRTPRGFLKSTRKEDGERDEVSGRFNVDEVHRFCWNIFWYNYLKFFSTWIRSESRPVHWPLLSVWFLTGCLVTHIQDWFIYSRSWIKIQLSNGVTWNIWFVIRKWNKRHLSEAVWYSDIKWSFKRPPLGFLKIL